jgi:hypothetical protein
LNDYPRFHSKPEKIDFNFNSELSADRKKFLRDPNYAEKGQIFHFFFETELGNLPRGRGGIKVGVGPGEFPKYLNFPFLTIFKNYRRTAKNFCAIRIMQKKGRFSIFSKLSLETSPGVRV